MDLGFITGMGWRDLVLVAAALLGVYLALSVMRLFQVGGKRRRPLAQASEISLDFNFSEPDVADAPGPGFADELARSSLEVEVTRLRREGTQLREELARLSEEVSQLKATRNVSPLYNEAMSLAQQGMPADGIAGHCGISIGEAELVAALARSDSGFNRQDDENELEQEDHDERYAATGSGTGTGRRAQR